jgi:nucleotide-binding universal stress UspA family protein
MCGRLPSMQRYRHILAATDFSPLGDSAVARAVALAISTGAELTLVHVLDHSEPATPYSSYDVTDRATRLTHSRAAAERALAERSVDVVSVKQLVLEGDPADTLVATLESQKPDLVVIATHGRTGIQRLILGSVSERIVRESPRLRTDVLVVSPDRDAVGP